MSIDELLALPGQLPPPTVRTALREASGYSRTEVAEAIGVTRAAFSRWETGEAAPHPRNRVLYVEFLRKLAARHPEVDLEGAVLGPP